MYRKFLLRQSIPMFKSEHLQCLFLWASSFSQHQSRPIWLLCLWCLYPGLASLCHTCTLGTLRLSINWVEVFRILECCFTLLKTKAKITMNRVTCVSKYNGERDKKRPEDHLKHLCMGHIWRGDKCNICPRWRPQEVERQRQTRSDNYLADKTLDMPLDVQSLESPVSYRPVTSKTLWQNLLSIALITESRTPCSNEVITLSWICHQSSVICHLSSVISPDSRYVRLPENCTEQPTHWKHSGCQFLSIALTHSWHNSGLFAEWHLDIIWYLGDVLITFGANGDKLPHVIILAVELIMLRVRYDSWKNTVSKVLFTDDKYCLPGSARLIWHTEQVKWCSW